MKNHNVLSIIFVAEGLGSAAKAEARQMCVLSPSNRYHMLRSCEPNRGLQQSTSTPFHLLSTLTPDLPGSELTSK